MRVFVEYRVPVLVEVDDETGAVVSVPVEDAWVAEPNAVVNDFELSVAGERRLQSIADRSNSPAWEVGV